MFRRKITALVCAGLFAVSYNMACFGELRVENGTSSSSGLLEAKTGTEYR